MIRMLAFATLGFVVYELVQGMREGSSRHELSDDDQHDFTQATRFSAEEGMRVMTEDGNGTSVPHAVGRGVLH